MAQTNIALVSLCLAVIAVAVSRTNSACGNGYTCLPMLRCFDLHRGTDAIDTMVIFPCSSKPGHICCPPGPIRLQAAVVEDPESNKRLLPINECGELGAIRINNGQEASLGQFPWMALLAYRLNESSTTRDYLCGGTLISRRYVMTAAHCLTDDRVGYPVYVRLGEHDLTNETDCTDMFCAAKPVDVAIEKVIIHEMYNKPYLKNDIALLRLKEDVIPSLYTLPICLPFGLNVTGEEEKKYMVAGWGKIEDVSVRGSDILLFTTVASAPVSECNDQQSEEVRPINELQLCAGGQGGNDACKGDSGGPMMETVADKITKTSKTYQVGIVSFGTTPCGAETPSVYTRVSSYLTWILTKIEP